MRIAFLTTEYVTEPNFDGGLANYLYRIAIALKTLKHDVEIFVLTNRNGSLVHDGILIHRIKHKTIKNFYIARSLNILIGAYLMKRAVLRRIKQHKIDIVQAASYLSPGFFLTRKPILPVVTRISSSTCIWRAAEGRRSYLDDTILERLEMLQMVHSDGCYAPTDMLISHINMLEPLKIDVIRPPYLLNSSNMDFSIFNNYSHIKNYLLFYGTIMNTKGINFLCSNLKTILSKNINIDFIFIGRYGKEEMFKRAATPYENRVHYIPSLDKPQLIPFIQNARAIILPSKLDNLPNTCLESMGFGKIVITTYTSGCKDIIIHGTNGFLIHYGNDDELYMVVNQICQMNIEQLNKIGGQAIKTILEKFNPHANAEVLVNYFKDVIKTWNNKWNLTHENIV